MTQECSECDKPARTRGLCNTHYSRFRRTGSITRTKPVRADNPICSVDGCVRDNYANGFCSMHYQTSRGPIYTLWRNIRNGTAADEYPVEWDSFEFFSTVIPPKPGDGYQYRRKDPTAPWSLENAHWLRPVRDSNTGATSDRRAYDRAWKYLRKFGLTEADIRKIEEKQRGLCPICEQPLRRIDPATNKPVKVCLDHNHRTGKARGLLDDACNKGLGSFDDNIQSLRNAVAYLEKYEA